MITKNRVYGLDIMRATAILAVLVSHLYWAVGIPVSLQTFAKFEFDGVDIFFTLSGFLIGNILFKSLSVDDISFKTLLRFWQSRWWRTLPAYLFVLLTLLPTYFIRQQITPKQTWLYFVFLQNIHSGQLPMFGESWSLTVEEWFYLTAPICLFVCAKYFNLKRTAPIVILSYLVIGNALRIFRISQFSNITLMDYTYYIRMALPTRIDAVMFGVIGAYFSYYDFHFWQKYKFIFFIVGVSGFILQHEILFWHLPQPTPYLLYFYQNVELLFCLLTLPYLSTLKNGKGMLARIVTFISLISYSIYLLHASFYGNYIQLWLPNNLWLRIFAYFFFAIVGGYIGYSTVEKWGLKQRAKYR